MAKLTLTQEEKDAPHYMDWDDATIGKAVRSAIAAIGREETDENGKKRMFLMSAAFVLIGSCIQTNGAELDITIEEATVLGKGVGTWRIRVDQVTEGELTEEIAEKVRRDNERDGVKLEKINLRIDNP